MASSLGSRFVFGSVQGVRESPRRYLPTVPSLSLAQRNPCFEEEPGCSAASWMQDLDMAPLPRAAAQAPRSYATIYTPTKSLGQRYAVTPDPLLRSAPMLRCSVRSPGMVPRRWSLLLRSALMLCPLHTTSVIYSVDFIVRSAAKIVRYCQWQGNNLRSTNLSPGTPRRRENKNSNSKVVLQ